MYTMLAGSMLETVYNSLEQAVNTPILASAGIEGLLATGGAIVIGGLITAAIALTGIKVIPEYERGVVLRLGRNAGERGPGLTYCIPFIDRMYRCKVSRITEDLDDQVVQTKDGIQLTVNGKISYKVTSPQLALLKVDDYRGDILQEANTILKGTIGQYTLDELNQKKQEISDAILKDVENIIEAYGIDVLDISIKDIKVPEELQRTNAKAAEAEREAAAIRIKAHAEDDAAELYASAAEKLAKTPGAMQLRWMQSLNDISSDQSNTLVFVPMEIPIAIKQIADAMSAKPQSQ